VNRIALFCAAVLVPISACAQAIEPVNLTSEEVVTLIRGKSLVTQNTRWGSVSLQFKEDGAL
jgi:hypothetical protein